MKERVKAREAADILGVSREMVIKLANKGSLPGAAKIGSHWTFDREKLRRYIRECEYQCQRKISICETEYGGYQLPSAGNSTEKAYTLAMSKLLGKNVTKQLPR